VGGPLNIENPYVSRMNSIKLRERYQRNTGVDTAAISRKIGDVYYFLENPILPRPTKYFDTDLETSIKRMKESERVLQKLPQIDCGCCGAPTCTAFAEDLVRGEAELSDCVLLGGGDRAWGG
jgi:hypothetical protein